jgi:hypothetical protein
MRQLALLGAAAMAVLAATMDPAAAQTRAFVSGLGSDANPCTLAAPCRSFQQAHNTVAAGGEIVALDAAGYGGLTISKAVTVTAIGIEASITSSAATPMGITIAAGAADVVTLRGITVIWGGVPGHGILVNSAKSVTIRDCTITGFSGEGIDVVPSASLDVELRGVTASNNGIDGLQIRPTGSGTVTATVVDSDFSGNFIDGVVVSGEVSTGMIKATLSGIVAAKNGNTGIDVTSNSNNTNGNALPVVMVSGAKLANNQSGLVGSYLVQVFVDRTQISGNTQIGWQAANAFVKSYQTNNVNGNGNDGLNGVVQISAQ